MDLLSEALRTLPMSGCLIARAELTALWGLGLERFGGAVFHVMLDGSAWLDAGAGRRIRLRSGDIVVLMRGESHLLLSDREAAVTSFSDLVEHCVPGRFPEIRVQGGGARATMLCGFFNFDRRTTHPLLHALPDIIHVNVGASLGVLDGLVAMADAESGSPRPGSGALTDLLCGLLLIHVLRAQLAVDSEAAAPWIRGLQDRRVGTALELIHADVAEPWSVARLASAVSMSRSSFAPRFVECVGESPMRYVARSRVLRAAQLLDADRISVTEAMHRVGYESESSFSKAFHRYLGCSPGAYRAARAASSPSRRRART
jgi:AraC-like DNA-binding protein